MVRDEERSSGVWRTGEDLDGRWCFIPSRVKTSLFHSLSHLPLPPGDPRVILTGGLRGVRPRVCVCMTVTSSRSRQRRRCWPFEWRDLGLYYNTVMWSNHMVRGVEALTNYIEDRAYIAVSFTSFPFLIFTDTSMNQYRYHCWPNYKLFFLIKLDMCRTTMSLLTQKHAYNRGCFCLWTI